MPRLRNSVDEITAILFVPEHNTDVEDARGLFLASPKTVIRQVWHTVCL